jgi:predicted HicB family RNase H-like nuclease
MNYKGYTARYAYDEEERVYHGRVDGIRDVVTFEAPTVDGLQREFQVSVDTYLEYCAERGRAPERPITRAAS